MRKVPISIVAMMLSAAVSLPVCDTARADLVPGGWLQAPRVPEPPPTPEAAPTPEPAVAAPIASPPPPPKATRPAVQHRPPPARPAPPSDGKVQF